MADRQRPDWLGELIGVVKQLCPGNERDRLDGAARKPPQRIGRVSPDSELGTGWFWIGLAGRKLDDDQFETAHLAPAEGTHQHKFQLIETLQDGNVLKVRVAEHAPTEGLFLWAPARDSDLLDKALLDGLAAIDRYALVSQFATGQADAVPANPVGNSTAALNAEQRRAWQACRSPGVHLVWGPPGTGKTKVIAEALHTLIRDGKTTLLVSATNIAVDNALAKAAAAIGPAPGVMVRAGTPHLPDIAQNPAIHLEKLVRSRQEALEQERHQLEDQVAALLAHPAVIELAGVEADLEGFDVGAYQAADDRLKCARLLATRQAELAEAKEHEARTAAAARAAAAVLEKLSAEHAAAESARLLVTDADDRQRVLTDLTLSVGITENDLSRHELRHDRLAEQLSAARAHRRFGHRQLKTLIGENAQHLAAATERRDAAQERLRQLAPQLIARINANLRAALPYTPSSLADIDERLANAGKAARLERECWDSRFRRTRELTSEIRQLRLQPEPAADDDEVVFRVRARDLPGKFANLGELRKRAENIQQDIARLEGEHERVVSKMRKESIQVRREIVRDAKVVATTLAKLRISRELREREYDYVIVDEVSAACPPEVLYAASRALEGVTMLGDFLQNGPITPDAFKNSPEIAVLRWYGQDCFSLFGIRDAKSARANPGCVTLTRQYRFGSAINELANAVAYDGVLQAASAGDQVQHSSIVLVDVDGLGDELAGVHRDPHGGTAGWWPVGVLLAKALAEHAVHQAEEAGEGTRMKAGIVVPYRIQQQIIQDVLNESEASPQIDVGTSYRFQGREFDTVIFDLADDGKGWVADGNLDGSRYQAAGLRLFNVGITRARRHLYLIANAVTVRKARRGPLHAVQRLVDAGKITVIRAFDVIGLIDAPSGDPLASDLWQALRSQATLLDLFDEDRLPDELCQRIDDAQERIWLWSPWVGRRSEQLLPHLLAAQGRGVRVYPVVLPRDEVNRHLKPRHEELAALIEPTIYLAKEHQKIVIIDRSLAFIGSMNVLAHVPGSRHEVMALFQSAALVDQLLRHERADQLRRPPVCARCGTPVRHVRMLGDSGERRLHWLCVANRDGSKCDWRQPFPDQQKARNQPRPTKK